MVSFHSMWVAEGKRRMEKGKGKWRFQKQCVIANYFTMAVESNSD